MIVKPWLVPAPNAEVDTTTPSYPGQSEYGYQRGQSHANGPCQEETRLYEASLFVIEHPTTRRWLNWSWRVRSPPKQRANRYQRRKGHSCADFEMWTVQVQPWDIPMTSRDMAKTKTGASNQRALDQHFCPWILSFSSVADNFRDRWPFQAAPTARPLRNSTGLWSNHLLRLKSSQGNDCIHAKLAVELRHHRSEPISRGV